MYRPRRTSHSIKDFPPIMILVWVFQSDRCGEFKVKAQRKFYKKGHKSFNENPEKCGWRWVDKDENALGAECFIEKWEYIEDAE